MPTVCLVSGLNSKVPAFVEFTKLGEQTLNKIIINQLYGILRSARWYEEN